MSELRFEWKNMLAADLGEESCVPDLLGERILQNSLKFYLDETDEIYVAYCETEKEKISKFITPITRLAALKCTIIIQ